MRTLETCTQETQIGGTNHHQYPKRTMDFRNKCSCYHVLYTLNQGELALYFYSPILQGTHVYIYIYMFYICMFANG